MKVIGIIPARYESTRFPGKPLVRIGGKEMIRLVYEKVKDAIDDVYVATDDKRIADRVARFGGKVIMTSPDHASGTDRCAEALRHIQHKESFNPGIVINVQGDEPFIKPAQIEQLVSAFDDTEVEIATLIKVIDSIDDLGNPNKPKVVVSERGDALYFSRSAIPFIRGVDFRNWLDNHKFYKHIGMYGYRSEVLLKLSDLAPSSLEKSESLEQVRWLQNGYKIRTSVTEWENIGIDTPEDLQNAKVMLNID